MKQNETNRAELANIDFYSNHDVYLRPGNSAYGDSMPLTRKP